MSEQMEKQIERLRRGEYRSFNEASLHIQALIIYIDNQQKQIAERDKRIVGLEEEWSKRCADAYDEGYSKGRVDTKEECAKAAENTKPPKSIGRDKGRHHSAGAQHAARNIRNLKQ